nr:MAG TPA: hypothetical protein [Caudoviricetes sp.]
MQHAVAKHFHKKVTKNVLKRCKNRTFRPRIDRDEKAVV